MSMSNDYDIFAYDEAEILEDSLIALCKTLDDINKKFKNNDITDDIVTYLDHQV